MHGGDLSEFCAKAKLSIDAVTGKNQLIPFDRFITLLEVAADELNYPDIALGLAQKQNISVLAPMSALLAGSHDFSEVLIKLLKYLEVLVSGFRIEVIERQDLLEMQFHVNLPELYPRQQFQNYLLASVVSLTRELVGWKYPLRGCFFTRHEPSEAQQKKHTAFFGCPVAFGADALRITIDKAILQEPVDALSILVSSKVYPLKTSRKDIEEQISGVIAMCLTTGKVNLDVVATTMGYSSRTLHRRLNAASISFRTTLDAVRLSQANQYLNSTHYKLSDIAALLGYSNQSAFTRSYIRWCGISPSQHRALLSETP